MNARSLYSRAGLICAASAALLLGACNSTGSNPGPGAAPGADTGNTPRPAPSAAPSPAPTGSALAPQERQITILATNDIHGGVEPSPDRQGKPEGGMATWGGIVQATRQGLAREYGSQAGTVLVDAGDQFQGTLISNFNEGQLVFAILNEIGYDAAITGNHDYDFGPIGWLDDQVTPQTADQNPRGALERVAGQARFPIISANTFYKSSIVDLNGRAVAVDGTGCAPAASGGPGIDWSRARTLPFLKPYVIKNVAGVRVALVGLDNPYTPTVTTPANVSDLCFADEAETYLRIRSQLEGQADVFVIVAHDGNTSTTFGMSATVGRILDARPGAVDAVIAGHTHYVNNARIRGVPLIQSGANGQMFGRIDLVYDTQAKAVEQARTRVYAGAYMYTDHCAPSIQGTICTENRDAHTVSFEGVPVQPDSAVQSLIAQARAQVAPVAGRRLGTADSEIDVDRIAESPLADALTDALRQLSGADVAFMNTGGLRAPIPAGDFTYEDLFRVVPFNNHGLVVGPMGADTLLKLLNRSVVTCGQYGALMESGLRVTFQRDCSNAPTGLDANAKLTHVETLAGEVLFDAASGIVPPAGRTLQVATLDFLAAGGAGYSEFSGLPVIQDMGIVREAMTSYFLEHPAHLTGRMDGRWQGAAPGPAPRPSR